MKNRRDRNLILLVIITVILNIAVLCFVFAPSEKKTYAFSEPHLKLNSDVALFDYWDDWKVGETMTPNDEDVQTLLGILDRQRWEGLYAAEALSFGIIEDGGREDTARLMLVRHLDEGEELFGQTGDVLINYRINLWSGTVTVGNLTSSSTTSARICTLSDKDVLKIKEILYRNFAGVSEIISLNPNRPNFTFRQSSRDALSMYSISLYTWDNRFSRSAIHMSMSLGGTYEYIRDEEGTRLILKYTDDIYDQFWVEKGKLIYDRKNSQGESPFSDGTEFTYADVYTDLSGYYGSAAADLNKNGVLETVYLGLGFTSGVFSFSINVKENGEQIYSGNVISPYGEPSFAVKNGSLCLRFEVEGGVKDFAFSFEDDTVILTGDDGEVLRDQAEKLPSANGSSILISSHREKTGEDGRFAIDSRGYEIPIESELFEEYANALADLKLYPCNADQRIDFSTNYYLINYISGANEDYQGVRILFNETDNYVGVTINSSKEGLFSQKTYEVKNMARWRIAFEELLRKSERYKDE